MTMLKEPSEAETCKVSPSAPANGLAGVVATVSSSHATDKPRGGPAPAAPTEPELVAAILNDGFLNTKVHVDDAAPTERQLDSFGRDLREANLATMVKRLAHCLREDNEKLRNQAFDLLKRMDLLGPPLRSEYTEGTERRSGAERRNLTYSRDTQKQLWSDRFAHEHRGSFIERGPQDRRQAPQPSTRTEMKCVKCGGFSSARVCWHCSQTPAHLAESMAYSGGIAGTAGEDAELPPALNFILRAAVDNCGTPFGCSDCVFASNGEDVNHADPDEGYYDCSLINKKRVWGEDPKCSPSDWKKRAEEEFRVRIETLARERDEHKAYHTKVAWSLAEVDKERLEWQQRAESAEALHKELIMAVARKHPNESRHQTALRYINERESEDVKAGEAAKARLREEK